MKLLVFPYLCAFASLSLQVSSATPPKNSILHDLNGDGKMETISWIKYTSTEDLGDFYQLRVYSSQGDLIWQGPKGTDIQNPLILGDWDFGAALPQLAADIDGDGAVELIIPEPQSDVSPTQFRVLRWSHESFSLVHSKILLEKMRGSGIFFWSKTKQQEGAWISRFQHVDKNGLIQVNISELRSNSEFKSGIALVASSAKGFEVRSWISPMKKIPPSSENSAETTHPSHLKPKRFYIARLSLEDHYNSSGTQLLNVGDILRQDRANFYKNHGDKEDHRDPFFKTLKQRNFMLKRQIVPTDPHASGAPFRAWWKATILKEAPLVEVEVTDHLLRVQILKPSYSNNHPSADLDKKQSNKEDLLRWVSLQPWYRKLTDSMPRGVRLQLSMGTPENSTTDSIEIREIHSKDSKFDPAVSPLVGVITISKNRRSVMWLNPISCAPESIESFLKSRGIKTP